MEIPFTLSAIIIKMKNFRKLFFFSKYYTLNSVTIIINILNIKEIFVYWFFRYSTKIY